MSFELWSSLRRTFTTIVTTLAGIALVGCAAMRAQVDRPASKSASSRTARNSSGRPEVWRSQTTHNEYRVELAGRTLRAEWINIPTSLASHGAYIHTECRHVGTKWVGTSSSFLPCRLGGGPKEQAANWCKLVTRTEIDTMTADRITGRAQGLKRFDCQRCAILLADWKNFVWVRAGQKAEGRKP